MLATPPIPAAVPKPAPTPALGAPTPPAGAAAGAAPGAPKVDDAVPATAPTAPAGQAADGAAQHGPAPNGDAAPADAAAAAKQAVLDKLEQTTASDAIAKVDDHLAKLSTLSVGGGTPEGAQGAKVASALLTDSSMLLQHAHVKAMEQLRTMATELHMRMMSSVSGLAYIGGQVAMAGQSKAPVKLADIAAGPITQTKETMSDVLAAIMPKEDVVAGPPAVPGAPDAPTVPGAPTAPDATAPTAPAAPGAPSAPDAPKPAADTPKPAADTPKPDAKAVPVPSAPNGNTGVAGGVAPPRNLQHVTPGPGAGMGPNPA
jgi:hypothetical protein